MRKFSPNLELHVMQPRSQGLPARFLTRGEGGGQGPGKRWSRDYKNVGYFFHAGYLRQGAVQKINHKCINYSKNHW